MLDHGSMMEPQDLQAREVLRALHSSEQGLRSAESGVRLARDGPNEVVQRAVEPAWRKLLSQFTHLFAMVLWIAAGLCLIAAWHDPQGSLMTLATAIVAVIAVNGIFSFLQEQRAERAVAALRRLLPLRARVLRDGAPVELDARELVCGDVVLLEAGDQVPADCRLIAAASVRVNASALTGEAEPEPRDASCTGDGGALRAPNLALAGMFVVSGRARGVVFATGMRTELGRIAELTQERRPALSPLQIEIARLARVIAVLATVLGAAFFAVGYALGLPLSTTLLFGVGILVANVPEGLLPTVTLALAMASQRMARRNALVRKLPAVEALGSATVICTDKTGTLTQNRMEIASIFCGGALHPAAEAERLRAEHPALFDGAALCNDIVAGRGDPMDLALARLGGPRHAERIGELPFDGDRRRLTTLHDLDGALVLHVKGAFEKVLPLCTNIDLDAARQQAEALADRGLRVLAFAHADKDGLDERDLTFDGLVAFDDPPRAEVPDAIARCRAAGIRVIMVTGDHPRTAVAVARRIGLAREPSVVTGDEVRAMSAPALDRAVNARELIVARADPADKRLIVEALRRNGEVVAVTGDGANDAPALHDADIGIAMGRSGTDVARAAADLVLLDDNFASIVAAVEEGRAVFANIRKFMTYILTSNVPELMPYLAFVLLRMPLALTILQILAVDLGTDMVPALALGAERPDAGVMQRPPRRRGERLFDAGLFARAYLWLGAFEAAAAMTAFWWTLRHGSYVQATTACLAAIVLMQVANVLICRSETQPISLRGNGLLAAGVALELLLGALIVYTPAGNSLFETAPLEARDWLAAVPFALAMIAAEELRKTVVRRRR